MVNVLALFMFEVMIYVFETYGRTSS